MYLIPIYNEKKHLIGRTLSVNYTHVSVSKTLTYKPFN